MRMSRKTAAILGYASVLGGAWLLHESYERRGRNRPFLAKFLP